MGRYEMEERLLERLGFPVVKTSAKTGAEVEETFAALARGMAAD